MEQTPGTRIIFDLFESSGIGLVGLDADNTIVAANRNVGVYLGIEPDELLGQNVSLLRPAIRSAEFWTAFPATFYCLAPGPHNLLLIVSRRLGPEHDPVLRRAIIMRPYSLEREFGRMRVSLNNYLAHEVASRLNSVGIASEFITEPELRQSQQTREAFITTFRHDVGDLNTLFVQLLETAEQIAMPNRVVRAPVDLRTLIEDLAAKVQGLASERNTFLSSTLPPHLPFTSGDYHWLYLGLYGVLKHALRAAPALTDVTLAASAGDGDGEVAIVITVRQGAEEGADPWPPSALFPLDDAHPRIGTLAIGELAVVRAIFLMHAGELRVARLADRTEYTVTLPV
jgi:signal transduction histidine kinase